MAHTAFRAKQFQKSADLYKKNIDILTNNEKKEFMHALRYTGDDDFLVALSNIDIPDYLKKYFQVSWTCEHEFITCEKSIAEYGYDYEPVNDVEEALRNYSTIGNKDINYKEALMVGAWYKHGDYTTAINLGERILRRRPDYRPVLKIV